jgi:hypothetical protein
MAMLLLAASGLLLWAWQLLASVATSKLHVALCIFAAVLSSPSLARRLLSEASTVVGAVSAACMQLHAVLQRSVLAPAFQVQWGSQLLQAASHLAAPLQLVQNATGLLLSALCCCALQLLHGALCSSLRQLCAVLPNSSVGPLLLLQLWIDIEEEEEEEALSCLWGSAALSVLALLRSLRSLPCLLLLAAAPSLLLPAGSAAPTLSLLVKAGLGAWALRAVCGQSDLPSLCSPACASLQRLLCCSWPPPGTLSASCAAA